jgi:hypothetical protein
VKISRILCPFKGNTQTQTCHTLLVTQKLIVEYIFSHPCLFVVTAPAHLYLRHSHSLLPPSCSYHSNNLATGPSELLKFSFKFIPDKHLHVHPSLLSHRVPRSRLASLVHALFFLGARSLYFSASRQKIRPGRQSSPSGFQLHCNAVIVL